VITVPTKRIAGLLEKIALSVISDFLPSFFMLISCIRAGAFVKLLRKFL
jgi:uncharacterized membrane protein YcfT